MKDLVKRIGAAVVMGAAVQAGSQLWDDVLKDKTYDFARKLGKAIKTEKKES